MSRKGQGPEEEKLTTSWVRSQSWRFLTSKIVNSATEYLATLESKFPRGKGLKCLLLDSCYDDTDEDEKKAYDTTMERLWDLLDNAPSLPTVKVQQVETESRQLKNKIEEKEKMIKVIEENRLVFIFRVVLNTNVSN